jgi:hypothetical protein
VRRQKVGQLEQRVNKLRDEVQRREKAKVVATNVKGRYCLLSVDTLEVEKCLRERFRWFDIEHLESPANNEVEMVQVQVGKSGLQAKKWQVKDVVVDGSSDIVALQCSSKVRPSLGTVLIIGKTPYAIVSKLKWQERTGTTEIWATPLADVKVPKNGS